MTDVEATPTRRSAAVRAGVMGSPISHSLSPVLHRAAYAGLGLVGWAYDLMEVAEPELPAALDHLGARWVGVSLTMPLKHAVLALVDELTDLAAQVGAANTVTFRSGRRIGDNTDVEGIVRALRGAGPLDVERSVVLGGGATAASAVAALRELGQRRPVVIVRSVERSRPLMQAAQRLGVDLEVAGWDRALELVSGSTAVVSTVPAGAADALAGELGGYADYAGPSGPAGLAGSTLLDVVYRPWPTPLAAAWERAGGRAVPGLEMLVHQAAAQVRAWSGQDPDVAAMREAARAATADDDQRISASLGQSRQEGPGLSR